MVRELPCLVRGELARLLEHPVRDGDLAEVVQTTRELRCSTSSSSSPSWRAIDSTSRATCSECAPVLVLCVDDADEALGGAQPRLALDGRSSSAGACASATAALYAQKRFFPFCFAQ